MIYLTNTGTPHVHLDQGHIVGGAGRSLFNHVVLYPFQTCDSDVDQTSGHFLAS